MNNPASTGLQNNVLGSYVTLPIPPGEIAGAKPQDNKSAQGHEAAAPPPETGSPKGHNLNTFG